MYTGLKPVYPNQSLYNVGTLIKPLNELTLFLDMRLELQDQILHMTAVIKKNILFLFW